MSVFYDEASLVVVPSGYKSGKIYAQKPLTTDGQLTFTRASTATRVNASGLIEEVASGVPRLDYLGSTCPKLLLEPAATTLLTHSEELENAAWDKTSGGAAITANSLAAPDGTTTADTITGTGTSVAFVLVRQTLTVAAAGTYTFSGFFKYNNHPFVSLNLSAYDGGGEAYYNIQTGVVTSATTGVTAKIENYGNGWYRCSLTAAIGASDLTGRPSVYVAYSGTTSDFPTAGEAADKAVYAWGFNMCLGAYATSYVKTEAAAVTRLADAASKTGISSLIGQTEGTIFFEWSKDVLNFGSGFSYFQVGTSPNYVGIYIQSTNCVCEVLNAGIVQASISKTSVGIGTHKAAVAYANNDIVFYFDGVQVGTDTSATIPAVSSFFLNENSGIAEKINQALLFKTRLSNAKLAELTTL
jgi:hypothetical protein